MTAEADPAILNGPDLPHLQQVNIKTITSKIVLYILSLNKQIIKEYVIIAQLILHFGYKMFGLLFY